MRVVNGLSVSEYSLAFLYSFLLFLKPCHFFWECSLVPSSDLSLSVHPGGLGMGNFQWKEPKRWCKSSLPCFLVSGGWERLPYLLQSKPQELFSPPLWASRRLWAFLLTLKLKLGDRLVVFPVFLFLELIYNVVLISGTQQSDHYILFLYSFPL